jgi:integrase
MLKKAKAILIGVFTLARNQGVLDASNPVPGTMLPKKAAAPPEMHATTPEEVVAILDAIENAKPEGKEIKRLQRLQAKAAVALQFFAGCGQAKHAAPAGKITTASVSLCAIRFGTRTLRRQKRKTPPNLCR